jgi:hypothetical protein
LKKNAYIIVFIGILVLVVFVSGCTSNNTTSNQSSGNVNLQVISSSPWNGTLTYNGADYQINGGSNIEKGYDLGPNPGHVAIYIKKFDNSGNLTARLLQDTKIIQTQTIFSRQEAVNITHNF